VDVPTNQHPHPISMVNDTSFLGTCPFCGAEVERRHVILEYQAEDGETRVWAECPDCCEVVDPE